MRATTLFWPLIFSFGWLLVFSSCTQKPDFPSEPVITFVSWDRTSVVQGTTNDQVRLTIEFTDGDGDLITEDTIHSIFFMDLRDSTTFTRFALPQIPENGLKNGISGEIEMSLFQSLGFCCIYPNGAPPCHPAAGFPTDSLVYEIFIEDRAGHRSNLIQTDPLIIQCD